MEEIKDLKRKLYLKLIQLTELNDTEIKIMYQLSLDKDIQEIFDKKLNESQNNKK